MTSSTTVDQSSTVGTISALVVLGSKISQQINDFLTHTTSPPKDISGVSNELSELCSVLSSLEGILRHKFNSISPFPKGVAKNLSIALDNCMKELSNLQTVVQKLVDSEKGGSIIENLKNWRFSSADKDLEKIQDSLEAQKGTFDITLSLANSLPPPEAHKGIQPDQLAPMLQQQMTISTPNQAGPEQSSVRGGIITTSITSSTTILGGLPHYIKRIPKYPSPNAKGMESALTSAVNCGQDNIVEQLLDAGVDPSTPGVLPQAAWDGSLKIVELLLDFGSNINAVNKHGHTGLSAASERGWEAILLLLLDRGADPNYADKHAISALMRGIDHPKMVKLLLDRGANPNTTGVIQKAAWEGQIQTVQFLLDAGADPNMPDPHNKTAFQAAAEQGRNDIVQLLLTHSFSPATIRQPDPSQQPQQLQQPPQSQPQPQAQPQQQQPTGRLSPAPPLQQQDYHQPSTVSQPAFIAYSQQGSSTVQAAAYSQPQASGYPLQQQSSYPQQSSPIPQAAYMQQPPSGYAPQQPGGYQQQGSPPPQAPTYGQLGAPGYPPQQQLGGYPPQQPGSYPQQQPGGYQQQQPGGYQQQGAGAYPPQGPGSYPPQGVPPPQPQGKMGGFMNQITSKIPGGKNTALGVGAGLLAGGILEHEWDKHESHRRHHHLGGLGSMFGFGGPTVIEENVTINNDYVVDDNNNFIF